MRSTPFITTLVFLFGLAGAAAAKSLIVGGWWATWHEGQFPISAIPWSKYTSMTYSFGLTTADPKVITIAEPASLTQFVSTAHSHKVKAMLSIGGWTGGVYFSTHVGPANRNTFAHTVLNLANQYHLDGIEFDWEFPGRTGYAGNVVSKSDSANFLAFLKVLRGIAPKLILTVAATDQPFVDATGAPMKDASGFGKVLDYVEIMNYDIWGTWKQNVGPYSPLQDSCVAPSMRSGSAASAVKAWVAAGVPASKLVLGVTAGGQSYYVPKNTAVVNKKLAYYPTFDHTQFPGDDVWDGSHGTAGSCGLATTGTGSTNFWGLIECGFLNKDGSLASGMYHRFDSCSKTPYVYDPKRQVMVSYDDATSFGDKGAYVKSAGLAGYAMWEAGGDYNNILINAIRKGAGQS